MATQTVDMPQKKKPKAAAKPGVDRERYRKPFTPVRIRHALAVVAKERAESLAEDLAQYVNTALRMRLEAEGLWPPPP